MRNQTQKFLQPINYSKYGAVLQNSSVYNFVYKWSSMNIFANLVLGKTLWCPNGNVGLHEGGAVTQGEPVFGGQ